MPLPLPLHKRRLPLPTENRPAKERPPPQLAAGLATGGSPLRASCSRSPLRAPRCKRLCPWAALLLVGVAPCGRRWPPLQASPGHNWTPPCMGSWPQPGRGWPTLHGG
ncbi:hypothetical protein GW17_00059230 [Ensete ventricosum]|nr:hypothetical protein GW17_00059230 [Ensete ventricosum]RZR99652.1 hypothetical protein BHM03_00029225 [Ensete ventricosum]